MPNTDELVAITVGKPAHSIPITRFVDTLKKVAIWFDAPTETVHLSIRKCTFHHVVVHEDHLSNALGLSPGADSTGINVILMLDCLNFALLEGEPVQDVFLERVETTVPLTMDLLNEWLGALHLFLDQFVDLLEWRR